MLGIRNTLIAGLRTRFPTLDIPHGALYRSSKQYAGLVIGSGATARSAVYALSLLGLSRIYILNRDDDEVKHLMALFPKMTKERRLKYLQIPTDIEYYLEKSISPVVLMTVGTIPTSTFFSFTSNHKIPNFFFFFIASVTPVTIVLYTTFSAVLEIPYSKPLPRKGRLALPLKPLFFETIVCNISCPN